MLVNNITSGRWKRNVIGGVDADSSATGDQQLKISAW